jgi:CRP-like cAMP-binding protein
VYFPLRGSLISIVTHLGDAKSFDAELVGYEGLVGVEPFLGVYETLFGATVRVGGAAWRLDTQALGPEFQRGSELSMIVQRYVQYMLVAVSQVAGCNGFHSLESHFCSWLLRIHDRTGAAEFAITHEVFARMLGVRRVGISQAARKLMEAGLIHYRWGKLTVLDRERLEGNACVCYARITQSYQRLIDAGWPSR